ncbi:MAG: hypothetical protein ACOVN9_13820, partial [Inhella sp.]
MNLLKAGKRLRLPSRELIGSVPADEARRLVRTHSSNFDAVRQGLAAAAPKLPAQSERSAAGKVQPKVAEAKPSVPSGDRLTLSKPATPSPAPAAPAAAPSSKEAALARDVAELKKLSDAAKQQVTPAPTPAPAAPVAATPAAPVAAVASAPASAVVAAPLPLPAASAPPVMASAPASVVPPRPVAAPAPAPAPAPASSSVMDMLLSPLGILGVALLALGGALAARFARRRKTGPAQETLFGESRLQPDSFFGVTGGQRVDTRDGASGVSSMSYSLSQLDAHGDVDPVAEADVYLAYGRDLQAEEILKEALRSQPERLAIRLKLMEVYAKRRDVRGFEQLATRLYADTKGQGEDWEKAQEMGLSIDPENRLYQPGGAPRSMFDEDGPRPEPTNATTLPQAGPLSLQLAEEAEAARQGPPSLIDLDLDLGAPAQPMQRTQPLPAAEPAPSALDMDLDISEAMPLDGKKENSLEFELSDLAELGGGTVSPGLAASTKPMNLTTEIQDLDQSPTTRVGGDSLMDAMQDMDGDDADPMMRQLELAEEFRQIGDVEGARDVLQELLSQ